MAGDIIARHSRNRFLMAGKSIVIREDAEDEDGLLVVVGGRSIPKSAARRTSRIAPAACNNALLPNVH